MAKVKAVTSYTAEDLRAALRPFLSGAPTREASPSGAAYLQALQDHLYTRVEQIFTIAGRPWSWDAVYEVGEEFTKLPSDKQGLPTRLQAAAVVAICASDLAGPELPANPDDRAATVAAAMHEIARIDSYSFAWTRRIELRARSHHANAAKKKVVDARLKRTEAAIKSGVRASPTELLRHFRIEKNDKNQELMRKDLERLRNRGPSGARR